MVLHIVPVVATARVAGRTYRMYRTAGMLREAEYEICACEHGRADRVMARMVNYSDAMLIIEALNNTGSKQHDETF